MAFLVNPFFFFYYEEKEELEERTMNVRILKIIILYNEFCFLANKFSNKMDVGIHRFSYRFDRTWVCEYFVYCFILYIFYFRAFVPQLATLPSNNSSSEWDNVKYLINHFDSSSKSTELLSSFFLINFNISRN